MKLSKSLFIILLIAVFASIKGYSDVGKLKDTFEIEVNEKGYVPSKIEIPSGLKKIKINFLRTTDKTCAREVILEEQNINKKLPLNKKVSISFDTSGSKELIFGCHMEKMFSGKIITVSK